VRAARTEPDPFGARSSIELADNEGTDMPAPTRARPWRTAGSISCLLAVTTVAAAAAKPPRPLTDIPELADRPARWGEVMDLFDVPGMAVAVVRDGQTYVQCFGARDPKSGDPVTPETLFYIASVTKTFTATAICELADEGRLRLDDPVRKYLPRFQLPDSALTRSITIRDLLCHRYGIDSTPIVFLDAFTGEITEDRYYHWLAQADIKARSNTPTCTSRSWGASSGV